jgi:hypothetical protein
MPHGYLRRRRPMRGMRGLCRRIGDLGLAHRVRSPRSGTARRSRPRGGSGAASCADHWDTLVRTSGSNALASSQVPLRGPDARGGVLSGRSFREAQWSGARLGRIGHESTGLIYGAAALANVSQEEADRSISEVRLTRGSFDVAASYGDAVLRPGLGCETSAAGSSSPLRPGNVPPRTPGRR